MHSGFYGVPEHYTNSLVGKATTYESNLLLDPLSNFVLLIANTYENSESFYSNAFDYGIVLRDYVDLHHFFLVYEADFDWDQAVKLFENLGMSDTLAIILRNYELIYAEKAHHAVPKRVKHLPSKWNRDIVARMGDEGLARQAAYARFRENLRSIASKHPFPFSLPSVTATHAESLCCSSTSVRFQIVKSGNEFVALWTIPCSIFDDSHLFQIGFYPLNDEADFLLAKVDLGLYGGEVKAYVHTTRRYLCAAAVKRTTNHVLPIEVEYIEEFARIAVRISRNALGFFWSADNQTAVSAEIYKQHQDNVFWLSSSESMEILEGVMIGNAKMLCDRGGFFSLTTNKYSFTASIDDDSLANRLQALFGASADCWTITSSLKVIRDYQISCSQPGVFNFAINGIDRANGQTCPEVSQLLLQDMTDCLCTQARGSVFVSHAAAINFKGRIVLMMGSSGAGKTSLAVGCAELGDLVGDECVFVNTKTGSAWCEDFPFQIKEVNDDILGFLGRSSALEVDGGVHGRACYFPRYSINADSRPTTPKAIRCIVFPEYNAKQEETTIGRLSHANLVRGILGSFIGDSSPSDAFRAFVHMVSANEIEIITIGYSNVEDAARALHRHLTGTGEWNYELSAYSGNGSRRL